MIEISAWLFALILALVTIISGTVGLVISSVLNSASAADDNNEYLKNINNKGE